MHPWDIAIKHSMRKSGMQANGRGESHVANERVPFSHGGTLSHGVPYGSCCMYSCVLRTRTQQNCVIPTGAQLVRTG